MITAMVTRIGSKRGRTHIRAWRKAKEWSQQVLADRMDTTKATISRYETWEAHGPGPEAREPDFETLEHLSDVLGGDVRFHPDRPSANDLLRGVSGEDHNKALGVIKAMFGKKAS